MKTKIKNQNGVIYTEYTIGNEIHFLLNGKAVSEKIVRVDTESCVMYTPTIKLTVKYWVKINDKYEIIHQEKAFETQKDLMESIIS